jgi:ADP-ribose pyrophosphatase YjhB (NUDIX family)
MSRLRNSVKAVIIEDGKILFNKMNSKSNGEEFFILPGGGQNPGETFVKTIKRECLEELGAEVEVSKLILVREYIGKNHEFAEKDSDIHQIEYMFRCNLSTNVNLNKAVEFDYQQVGHQWIELKELSIWNVYPKILKEVFDEEGSVLTDVYLGDSN